MSAPPDGVISGSKHANVGWNNLPFSLSTIELQSPARVSSQPPSDETSDKTHKILYPVGRAWAGMTPLEMVQNIATMAAEADDFETISDSDDGRLNDGRSILRKFLGIGSCSSETSDPHVGQKRKRRNFDDFQVDDAMDSSVEAVIARCDLEIDRKEDTFKIWKPSSIAPMSKNNHALVASLDVLANDFELMAVENRNKCCIPSYNRVQQSFFKNVRLAIGMGEWSKEFTTARKAISQMKALTKMVASAGKSRSSAVARVVSTGDSFEGGGCGGHGRHYTAPFPAKVNSVHQLESKDKFQYYMEFWLRQNWLNPFPDDLMMHHLANFMIQQRCVVLNKRDIAELETAKPMEYNQRLVSIAIEKLTNWLVNARSRRWRPAIEAAFNEKRPADLLIEDSLRIYADKKLRCIYGWDGDSLFSFDDRYSAPLSGWKKSWWSKTEKRSSGKVIHAPKRHIAHGSVDPSSHTNSNEARGGRDLPSDDNYAMEDFPWEDGSNEGLWAAV